MQGREIRGNGGQSFAMLQQPKRQASGKRREKEEEEKEEEAKLKSRDARPYGRHLKKEIMTRECSNFEIREYF